jgi:S1-C subfamily serine protease
MKASGLLATLLWLVLAAETVYYNPEWDLAGLEIDAPTGIVPVAISEAAPQKGEPVASCGYGPNGQYRCNQGRVTGYVRADGTEKFETLELTGAARDGDSGGPVFNQRGELVAVLWGTDRRGADRHGAAEVPDAARATADNPKAVWRRGRPGAVFQIRTCPVDSVTGAVAIRGGGRLAWS